jgi:DNA primase
MLNLFVEVKKNATFSEYIARFSDSSINRVGEGTHRASPCPMCNHNDCFTIYDGNQTFHCFSCGKTGDIIHLEKYLNGLSSNLEAALSLSKKFQIELQEHSKPMNSTTGNKHLKPVDMPQKPNTKLLALRNIAAVYFHDLLLKNQTAMNYLLKVRGHSIEVIKHFKIGIAGGNLIAHVTTQGYSVADLENVGLVRKNKQGYSNTIRSGMYVFPHTKAGDVLFFSIKDPGKRYKFQIKKKYAEPGWICMNQDALDNSSVIMVEGEDDLLSVFDKAKQTNVAAVLGNFNTTNILTYLKNNSASKSYYLAFDNDDAGRGYTKKYSAAILAGGGKVYAIKL